MLRKPRLKRRRPRNRNSLFAVPEEGGCGRLFLLVCFRCRPGRARYNDFMSVLRHLIAASATLALLLPVQSASAADADGLESTRRLGESGAAQLAIYRIDRLQPQDATQPQWAEWEQLRLQLLARTGRHEAVVQRVDVMPAGVAAQARPALHALAVDSALQIGRPVVARDHAARALWAAEPGAARLRELRRLVIRSYMRESRGEDAYRSMLRFEQDYRPLDAETAAGFVNGLLDVGMAREAVTWLGLLDERGAPRLRLRLHTGLVKPEEVATLARAGLMRNADPVWWRILLEAGERMRDGALRIEALEQLLNVKDASAADARTLWDAYVNYARDAANVHQLLAGDDVSWMQFASGRREAAPVVARAYFAYLARNARQEPERQQAQSQLAAAYAAARLSRTALHVFASWPGQPAALVATARYTLGTLAEGAAAPEDALRYLQDLPAPDGTGEFDWKLHLAALALRAGQTRAAADMARQLGTLRAAIPAAQIPQWITVAQQFADHGQYEGARAVYERVLPQAGALQARVVLAGLARLHEVRDQPLLAADYYLRAALAASGPDAAAVEARLQAGLNLVRAGLRDDARAQFEWLLQHARDPAQIAVARRELGF